MVHLDQFFLLGLVLDGDTRELDRMNNAQFGVIFHQLLGPEPSNQKPPAGALDKRVLWFRELPSCRP